MYPDGASLEIRVSVSVSSCELAVARPVPRWRPTARRALLPRSEIWTSPCSAAATSSDALIRRWSGRSLSCLPRSLAATTGYAPSMASRCLPRTATCRWKSGPGAVALAGIPVRTSPVLADGDPDVSILGDKYERHGRRTDHVSIRSTAGPRPPRAQASACELVGLRRTTVGALTTEPSCPESELIYLADLGRRLGSLGADSPSGTHAHFDLLMPWPFRS